CEFVERQLPFLFCSRRREDCGAEQPPVAFGRTDFWIGPRTNFVRATGPFDAELPVLAFRDSADKLRALIYNHSTHTIGTRKPGLRSPSFYGLAAQDLEAELGGRFTFLEGASGSTHNLDLSGDEATRRIKQAVVDALAQAT